MVQTLARSNLRKALIRKIAEQSKEDPPTNVQCKRQMTGGGFHISRFVVDFELAGHVEVEAEDVEEAIDRASAMPVEYLLDNVDIYNVGKNYVELLES
ncbi:MAG: hypothetical protein HW388_670 [Dehalococcoidia bacterium]|nr:hypothetical protein [Dehalococcoidia bacterium]